MPLTCMENPMALTALMQMADLKDNIEHEVQSAREEYMKMESHIRLYITEMEQSL